MERELSLPETKPCPSEASASLQAPDRLTLSMTMHRGLVRGDGGTEGCWGNWVAGKVL